jgi:hypothetical protein
MSEYYFICGCSRCENNNINNETQNLKQDEMAHHEQLNETNTAPAINDSLNEKDIQKETQRDLKEKEKFSFAKKQYQHKGPPKKKKIVVQTKQSESQNSKSTSNANLEDAVHRILSGKK